MATKNKAKATPIVITAIAALALMQIVALFNGINGTLFTATAVIIAGLGGYALPSPFQKK